MANSHLDLLLRLVYSDSGVEPLLKYGLTYSQIAKLIRKALEDGLITKTDSVLSVTPTGLEIMRLNESTGKKRKDGGWISPEEESRITILPVDGVYLPDAKIVFD